MEINSFRGKYGFLSNFFEAPITVNSKVYSTIEHAFQAIKCEYEHDHERVRLSSSPAAAKKLGRKFKMRSDWNEAKVAVMEALLYNKFTTHKCLAEYLIATKEYDLVEGNWWGDTFWGVCKEEGENMLGKLLMKVRGSLIKEKAREQVIDLIIKHDQLCQKP